MRHYLLGAGMLASLVAGCAHEPPAELIKARTAYKKPDGSAGAGWYTDDWQLRPEGWRCVSAHVSRS